ncbi:MAG TPA: dTDP-4-dehydrorhamnose 3,5-epimerase [Vicinamibacterales bacterium]|nr:dTDP-4-dehydrorhamnose 3,5-epimerase [Vicinamibacterales bacterium]
MRLTRTDLPGVVILEPEIHRDHRGFFVEIVHAGKLEALGIPNRVAQINQSRSVRGTLRGLHWQWRRPQAKLVRVLRGEIFDVAVDVRRGSPTFGRWVGVKLSEENFRQTYVPEGFAHGFCVLSETADVEYVCSDLYDPGGEAGLRWDDPTVGIRWPVSNPLLSERDRRHPLLDPARPDLPVYEADEGVGAREPGLKF